MAKGKRFQVGDVVRLTGAVLDSTGRYWLLNAIYHAHSDARRTGRDAEAARWRTAAAERRIKVRKVRGRAAVRVVVEPAEGGR